MMGMLTYIAFDPHAAEYLGFLPEMLNEQDERPAREQYDSNYQHGGGWRPFGEDQWIREELTITYPGDPPLTPVAMTKLREEEIYFYPYALVMILQKDGSFEIARMD
jgi:hypothetical protein